MKSLLCVSAGSCRKQVSNVQQLMSAQILSNKKETLYNCYSTYIPFRRRYSSNKNKNKSQCTKWRKARTSVVSPQNHPERALQPYRESNAITVVVLTRYIKHQIRLPPNSIKGLLYLLYLIRWVHSQSTRSTIGSLRIAVPMVPGYSKNISDLRPKMKRTVFGKNIFQLETEDTLCYRGMHAQTLTHERSCALT